MKCIKERCDEIGRLRGALAEASIKLKLLYMGAGLGTVRGLEALAALNAEIEKIDAALTAPYQGDQG